MKKSSKCLAAVLLACLIMTSFAGCGKEQSPIDLDIDLNNKPSLSFFMPNAAISEVAFNNSEPAQVIKKRTGYENVTYKQIPALETDSSIDAAFVNKSKFDAIKLTKAQFDNLLSKDIFLDVKPALEKYGPNLLKNISQESWEAVTYKGQVLGIPERVSSDSVDMTLVFRNDKLREAGIETLPDDIDSFKETLVKLKSHFSKKNPAYRPFGFAVANAFVQPIASAFDMPFIWEEGEGGLNHYSENDETKDYVKFMADLKTEGLLETTSTSNQTMTDAIAKFVDNDISCMVLGYWNVYDLVSKLAQKGIVNAENLEKETFEDILGYVPALADANGKVTKFRSGGISYITVFPFYMTQNTCYAIDWMDKKIETEAFKEITIGTEGIHHEVKDGEYLPLNFEAYKDASSYLTGTDEANYTKYWMARIRKTLEMFRCWSEGMVDIETLGKYNPATYAPPLIESARLRRSNFEVDFLNNICEMIGNGYTEAKFTAARDQWQTDGGAALKDELNGWWNAK